MTEMGRATWMWDDDLQVHLPCCTRLTGKHQVDGSLRPCGNGPLDNSQIADGDCGEHGPRDLEA